MKRLLIASLLTLLGIIASPSNADYAGDDYMVFWRFDVIGDDLKAFADKLQETALMERKECYSAERKEPDKRDGVVYVCPATAENLFTFNRIFYETTAAFIDKVVVSPVEMRTMAIRAATVNQCKTTCSQCKCYLNEAGACVPSAYSGGGTACFHLTIHPCIPK